MSTLEEKEASDRLFRICVAFEEACLSEMRDFNPEWVVLMSIVMARRDKIRAKFDAKWAKKSEAARRAKVAP